MKEVKMQTNCDCMVASLAMLLNCSYEQAADYFPPKAVRETGYRFEWLTPYLYRNKIYLTWYSEEILHLVNWDKPAIVDVPSLTAPEKGDHIIFWDGEKVIDPSNHKPSYKTLPKTINSVYQLRSYENRN